MRFSVFTSLVTAIISGSFVSCALQPTPRSTPFGPLVVDYSHNNHRKKIKTTGSVSTFHSPPAKDSIRGYGFFTGLGGPQTLRSNLVIHADRAKLPVPNELTFDLWNLDLPSAHLSEVRRINGLEGYAIHGGDGEKGYTVIFYYRGAECVGRVVSTLFEDVYCSLNGERTVLHSRIFKT